MLEILKIQYITQIWIHQLVVSSRQQPRLMWGKNGFNKSVLGSLQNLQESQAWSPHRQRQSPQSIDSSDEVTASQELNTDSTACTTYPWTVNKAFWPQNHILQSIKMDVPAATLIRVESTQSLPLHVTSIQPQTRNGSHARVLVMFLHHKFKDWEISCDVFNFSSRIQLFIM